MQNNPQLSSPLFTSCPIILVRCCCNFLALSPILAQNHWMAGPQLFPPKKLLLSDDRRWRTVHWETVWQRAKKNATFFHDSVEIRNIAVISVFISLKRGLFLNLRSWGRSGMVEILYQQRHGDHPEEL